MTQHVLFLGIGGIGMSALARWFHAQGAEVAGYDRTATALTQALQEEGIAVDHSGAEHRPPRKPSTGHCTGKSRPVDHRLDTRHSRGVPFAQTAPTGRFHVAKAGTGARKNQPKQACIGRRWDPRKNHNEHPIGPPPTPRWRSRRSFSWRHCPRSSIQLAPGREGRKKPLDGSRSG